MKIKLKPYHVEITDLTGPTMIEQFSFHEGEAIADLLDCLVRNGDRITPEITPALKRLRDAFSALTNDTDAFIITTQEIEP